MSAQPALLGETQGDAQISTEHFVWTLGALFGTSENAVKSQIWIAVSVYVLVAIVKKRLRLPASLYEILQILSLTMFERLPLHQLLAQAVADDVEHISNKQLILFE